MTDKQIIIDGVDVSGCVNRNDFKLASYDCYLKGGCQCKDNSSCYYKQYKRLEQLLPDINGKYYKAMDDLKAKEQECEKLRFPMKDTNYAILTKEEFEEYDQLKAENKKLKERTNRLLDEKDKYLDNWSINLIYKQTLTEIKKLVEKEFCRHPECCEFCAISNECVNQKIIEKINEVENES